MPRAKSKPGTALNHAVGTLPALFIIACLTNPRVRFGRRPDELNIWAPFRFYIGGIEPGTEVEGQHPGWTGAAGNEGRSLSTVSISVGCSWAFLAF
jgi:hypothetical protein